MTVFGIKPDNYFGDVFWRPQTGMGFAFSSTPCDRPMRVVRQLST